MRSEAGRAALLAGCIGLAGLWAILGGATRLPAGQADQPVAIIVHPDNPSTTMPRADVARMFLGQVTTWKHGGRVAAVDQSLVAPIREAFSEQVLDRTVDEVRAYWQRAVFSGRAVPPPVKESDELVVAFVAGNPHAIGYVSPWADLTGVKTVRFE